MTKLIELLRGLERDRFWGRIEIEFRAGDIQLVRKEQMIKLDLVRNTPNDDPRK